jgi:type I restriction enzyme S subunit
MNESLGFSKVVKDCTGGNVKIKQSNYLPEGFLPIVDQGKELIAGYVDDESMKYKGTLPCVIFGDHTCILKYVDFDFVLGADGTKILVPDSDEINAKYLYYFLNTVHIPDRGYSRHFKYLKRCKIPVVSLSEQKQIIQTLDTADTFRQKRKEQLNLLDDYLKSVFLEMFGDPVRNKKGWNVIKMLDVCSKVTDGTHDTPKRLDSGVKFITGKHIRPFKIDYENSDYVSQSDHEEIYRRCNPEKGDVLYTNIGVNVGTAALNTVDYPFSMKNVALLKLFKEKVTPRYIETLLNYEFVRSEILRKASLGGAQQFLGLQDIKKIDVPMPPIDLQNKFASIVEQVEQTKQKMRASLDEMDNHFNALMQRYFG